MKIKKLCLKFSVVPVLAFFAVNVVCAAPFVDGDSFTLKPKKASSIDPDSQQFCADFGSAFESANVTAIVHKNGLPTLKDSTGTFDFGKVTFVQDGNNDLRHVMVTYHAKDGETFVRVLSSDYKSNDDKNTNVVIVFGPCN